LPYIFFKEIMTYWSQNKQWRDCSIQTVTAICCWRGCIDIRYGCRTAKPK